MASNGIKQRAKPQKRGAEGSTTVRRAFYNMGDMYSEEERTDTITVPLFENPAYVKVSGSVTRNMGDFNSVRVSVDVSLPCHPEGSEIDRAYDIASSVVNQKVQDEVEYAYGREETKPK